MTTSLSSALRIATGSLQLNQSVLSTISHNIANVNSDNYTRQTVVVSSATLGSQSAGATISGIQRNVDSLLQERLSTQISNVAYNETKQSMLNTVESVLDVEPGVGTLTTSFFEDLSSLASKPESSSLRQNVVQSATLLTDTVNDVYSELTTAAISADNQIDTALDNVNQILKDIAQLNLDIVAATSSSVNGANANDLKDQLQQKSDELSEYLKLNTISQPDGSTSFYTENGRRLISGAGYVKLERTAGSGNYNDIAIRNVLENGSLGGSVQVLSANTLTSGSIKALVEVRDTIVPGLQAELDEFANTLKDEINTIHSQGSSTPPQNSLTSASYNISATNANIYTSMPALEGATFNVSVVNKTTGAVISTTAAAGGGAGPVTMTSPGPFSLDDLDTLLSANADIGGDITVTTSTDSNGYANITIAATNANYAIVLDNVSGDVTGSLKFNNFFSGTGASDLQVRSEISNDPSLIATAKMRASDGGLSLLDNQNAVALAAALDTDFSFSSAGGLSATTDSLSGYANKILSNFAMDRDDISERIEFETAIRDDLESRNDSLTGVNLDEELANMLMYQRSYQASAQIIRAVDEMMQILLNTV